MKTYCFWCLKEIDTEEGGIIKFPKQNSMFFCSEKCCNDATTKVRGKREIDCVKIRKHIKQIRQKQAHDKKLRFLDSLLEKEKLSTNDLVTLHNLLTPKQKLALSLVGLTNFAWAVHHEPKKLIAKIDDLVKVFDKDK